MARASAGVLAAWLAPGMLAAAGRNVAPVVPGNPIFTGALGRYDGVTLINSIPAPLDPGIALKEFEFFTGDQWSKAQHEMFTRGQAAIKVNTGKKAEWIPYQKIYPERIAGSKRRG